MSIAISVFWITYTVVSLHLIGEKVNQELLEESNKRRGFTHKTCGHEGS